MDRNTIWRFLELLKERHLIRPLFDLFDTYICQKRFFIRKGMMTDATFVDTSKQQNTKAENAHKNMDVRGAKKNEEVHYGYKDHAMSDTDHKFIRDGLVTSVNVHDSSPYLSKLPKRAIGDKTVYADSAYSASEIIAKLEYRGFHPEIYEKSDKRHPLTEEQKPNNNRKLKSRCRIEPIFGDMTNRMKTLTIRTIGLGRAEVKIGLMNLAYNMRRFLTLTKKAAITKF